jgi:hypothetical protein
VFYIADVGVILGWAIEGSKRSLILGILCNGDCKRVV